MAGITHLLEIYKKKGRDFLDKLFDGYVTINEKLDASAFSIEKDPVSKEIGFYKRNANEAISLVDRTLMRYYEKPIAHFTSLTNDIMEKLPSGWRFGFEYFVNEQPQEISYDRAPKNGLVLSYIHVKNGAGKTLRTIQEKVELDAWADLLQVERSPILFQGQLNNDQKISILEFLDTPGEELSAKYKTDSFVKFIVSVLNPKIKKTLLNENLTKPIEGIVFRFGTDDNDVVLAKIMDPIFEEMAKQKVHDKEANKMNDIFYMTIIDLANFIEGLNFKKFTPRGKTFEERYINFICQAFNELIAQKGDDYLDVDFNEPSFMKKEEFDLNTDFIKDQTTLSNILKNDSFKKLFKIMLSSFRKRKKKPVGVFTQEVIKQFNGTINKIQEHLAHGLRESEVPTFGQFLDIRGREVEEDVDEEDTLVETPVPSFSDFKSMVVNTEPVEGEKIKPSKGKRVNIVVGRFQPFHNGHMKMVEELSAANKLPCVVVIVHPGNNKSGNSPFNESTVLTMLNNIKGDTSGNIIDHRLVKRGFINDIMESLRPQYEPVLWGVGNDRLDDYKKQIQLNYTKSNELKLDADFAIMETRRLFNGTDVRQSIKEDKFADFKRMVPKSIVGLYPMFRKAFDTPDK